MSVVVTAPAENDLEEIFDFIASDSIGNARKYVSGLRKKVKSLGRFPLIHPEREYLPKGYRTAAHGSHVIVYRISGKIVEILGVVHGARDIESLFRDAP